MLQHLQSHIFAKTVKPIPQAKASRTIDWKVGMNKAEQKAVFSVDGKKPTVIKFEWKGKHDVFQFANAAAFASCDFSKSTILSELSPYTFKTSSLGTYWFGCRVAGHCKAGQKLAVVIAGASSPDQSCLYICLRDCANSRCSSIVVSCAPSLLL